MEFTGPITTESLYYLQARGDCLARARNVKPRTVEEILKAAGEQMDVEDLYLAWLHGEPVARKVPHPRRKLRALLRQRG